MSNALPELPHTDWITKPTACQKCHALRIPLKQFVSLNFNALDLPNLRWTRFRKPPNHLSFKTRNDSNFVAVHALWKSVNFENSFSENSKRTQNCQSDFAANWLTSRPPKKLNWGKRSKLALANNVDLPRNLNEWPKEERTDHNQLIFIVLS